MSHRRAHRSAKRTRRTALRRGELLILVAIAAATAGCDRSTPEGTQRTGGASSPSQATSRAGDVAAPTEATTAPRPADHSGVPRPPPSGTYAPVDARIRIAKAMLQSGQYENAERALATILTAHPDDAQTEFLLGVSIQKQKRYAAARPHFDRVISLGQSFPEVDYVFHFLGWCLYYLGDLDGARAAFEEHLRRVPAEADSHFGLAVIAIDDDRLDDAESRLRQAIEMQKSDPRASRDLAKAHARMADVRVRRGQMAEAEQELREAVRLYPNHYEAWAKLARVLDRRGATDEAALARAEEAKAIARVERGVQPEAPSGDRTPDQPPE